MQIIHPAPTLPCLAKLCKLSGSNLGCLPLLLHCKKPVRPAHVKPSADPQAAPFRTTANWWHTRQPHQLTEVLSTKAMQCLWQGSDKTLFCESKLKSCVPAKIKLNSLHTTSYPLYAHCSMDTAYSEPSWTGVDGPQYWQAQLQQLSLSDSFSCSAHLLQSGRVLARICLSICLVLSSMLQMHEHAEHLQQYRTSVIIVQFSDMVKGSC